MKNLENIKELACPECGAGIRSELRERRHTNGYWNEHRTFQCRKSLHFSPNFMRVIKSEQHICTQSKSYKEDLNKVSSFKSEILELARNKLSDKHYKRVAKNMMYLFGGPIEW